MNVIIFYYFFFVGTTRPSLYSGPSHQGIPPDAAAFPRWQASLCYRLTILTLGQAVLSRDCQVRNNYILSQSIGLNGILNHNV